jgi:hypothetical protein
MIFTRHDPAAFAARPEPRRPPRRPESMTRTRTTRIRNALVAVATLGVAVTAPVAAYGATPHATSSTPAASPPQCLTRNLHGRLRDGSGAAGSTYYKLYLHNIGASTCRLGGFPGVSYVSAKHGHQVGAAATRTGASHGWVTLAPGASSPALLQEVDPLNYPSGTCRLTHVAGLRVYPPNRKTWLFVRDSGQACANRSLSQLFIQALTP